MKKLIWTMTRDTAVQKEDQRQAIVSPVRFSKSAD